MTLTRIPAAERFWPKVEKADDCWQWIGAKTRSGYGNFYLGPRAVGDYEWCLAHRFSYELHVGQIPEGLTIDHLCRNRACVNPDHLEAVTLKENNLRGTSFAAVNARRTKCINGHPFDRVLGSGKRACSICSSERYRRRYLRRKARLAA